MARIENMAIEEEIASSLLTPSEQELEQAAPDQEQSEFSIHGDDWLNEAIADQHNNVIRDGDELVAALMQERSELAETGGQQAQPVRQQHQTQPTEQQQQPEQPIEPSPQQVTELLQSIDTSIEALGLSTTQEASKFAADIAPILGGDIYRDGWNVGLLDRTIGRTAFSVENALIAAQGDISRIAEVSPSIANVAARDLMVAFGGNPQINPPHDANRASNALFFGLANLRRTQIENGGVTDPKILNDGNMAVQFVQNLQEGLWGDTTPVNRERAIQFVNRVTEHVLPMFVKTREGFERQAASQSQGRRGNGGRGRGQRIPAGMRDGIKGSRGQRFSSNQDIFNPQVMDDLAMRRL